MPRLQPNNALRRRYVVGVRPVFMSTSASNAFYFHWDPLGSVRNVTTSSGGTSLTYDFEPFGATRTKTGSLANLVKFTGEYEDPTGLYHLRARQYDPVGGRFTRRDPAGQTIGGSALSSYVYAGDRPTVMVDPTGETFRPSGAAVAATQSAASGVRLLDSVALARAGGLRGGFSVHASLLVGVESVSAAWAVKAARGKQARFNVWVSIDGELRFESRTLTAPDHGNGGSKQFDCEKGRWNVVVLAVQGRNTKSDVADEYAPCAPAKSRGFRAAPVFAPPAKWQRRLPNPRPSPIPIPIVGYPFIIL